jgi:hypothetical protein
VFVSSAWFTEAKFNGPISFILSDFRSGCSFSSAIFSDIAIFKNVTFSEDARFGSVTFAGLADFSEILFQNSLEFESSRFDEGIKFSGFKGLNNLFTLKSSLSFQSAIFERPEHVSFHSISLRPHYFVNTDPRRFEFINVDWKWPGGDIEHPHKYIKQEIKKVSEHRIERHLGLLSIACARLATNAEDNNRYPEASNFRYLAMDLRRREKADGFAFWTFDWWYWLASGYGERIQKAFFILVCVWLLFAGLYTRTGFVRWEPKLSSQADIVAAQSDLVGEPLTFYRSLTYSLAVMTLQKPVPAPATNFARGSVILQTIFGPIQAALLALAIRRRFMR